MKVIKFNNMPSFSGDRVPTVRTSLKIVARISGGNLPRVVSRKGFGTG